MTDLAGKDYFTQAEAAHYCCVSESQFRKYAAEVGLQPGLFMGKIVYRRSDCQRAIEAHGYNNSPRGKLGPELVSGRPAASGEPRTDHRG